jgi:methylglutaconyl-CoA hydratase
LAKAKEMIYTSMKLTGEEALRINLINHLVENEEELNLKAIEISKKIISNGPISIKAAKESIDDGFNLTKEEALKVEERCYDKVLYSKDRIEGLKAFNEKRKAEYKGH